MAGFFGLFDYSKPGKGVRKDEPTKPRFIFFFELLLRKFWKLVQLNLLYILFCVPIVTIGPATAGMTYVLRNLATEQPVFLFSDFWDAFKSNWKQSAVYSVLLAVATALLMVSCQFYFANAAASNWMYIPLSLCFLMALIGLFMNYYISLMIVTLALPLRAIFKNAVLLAMLCLKTNLLTLLFTGLIILACALFPWIGILVFLFIGFALIGFIICFNSYQGIKKYAIDPFLEENKPLDEQQDLPAPTVFRDDQIIKDRD